MRKRAFKFILSLTALSVLIWVVGEVLIGEFINNYWVSVVWAAFCLVGCCAYSLWKCPREPEPSDEEDSKSSEK
jgi:hypothetical protein